MYNVKRPQSGTTICNLLHSIFPRNFQHSALRRLHIITRSHNNMGHYNVTNITAITTAMQRGRVTIYIWLFPGKTALQASAQYCTTQHSDTSELQNRIFTQTTACVTKMKPHICCNIAFHCCRPLVHVVACHGIRRPATGGIGH